MPTILINTNLLKANSTNPYGLGDDQQQQQQQWQQQRQSESLDAEFRQELNAIINKLLIKSETMESFTIKYETDDLGPKHGTTPHSARDGAKQLSTAATCVCHRMARLFADLLTPTTSGSDSECDERRNKRDMSTTTIVKMSPEQQDGATSGSLDSIYNEIKLLRKYQFDLDAKFNLLLTKLTNNQQQQQKSTEAPRFVASMTSTHKQPHLAMNSILRQQQQQHPVNGYSNSVKKSSSNHQSLTGAKKRKFNNNNMYGHAQHNKSRSPSSSSSNDSTASSNASAPSNQSGSNGVSSKSGAAEKESAGRPIRSLMSSHHQSHSRAPHLSTVSSSLSSSPHQKALNCLVDENGSSRVENADDESNDDQHASDVQVDFKSRRAGLDEENGGGGGVERSPSDLDRSANDLDVIENDDEIDEDAAGIDFGDMHNDENTAAAAADDDDDDNDDVLDLNNDNEFGVSSEYTCDEDADQTSSVKMQLSSQHLSQKFNHLARLNKQSISMAVQNHLKPSQANYLNYIYQQQQQQQHLGLTNNSKSTSGGVSVPSHHHHHHQQNQSSVVQNRMAFNRPSQDNAFASHLSHNNMSSKAPFHHPNHQTSSATSLLAQPKSHASLVAQPPSNSFSSILSQQQSQQQQQQQQQSLDIDINELFKGNGPKYLQLDSYKNFKPPISKLADGKYFVEETMAALSYSKSKSRRNFAAHLTKLVFSPRERLESNCNGRFGKKALDSVRLLAIRNTIFKYYPCKQSTLIVNGDAITSGDSDENSVWVRDCIPAIDESNRVLKKQLVAWYKKNNPDKFPTGFKMECSFNSGGPGFTAGAYQSQDFEEEEFDEQE